MFASPHGTGWTEDKHFHDYLNRAREAGITGSEMTLAAGSYSSNQYLSEHYQFRRVMAQAPDKYTFVRSVRDIEQAHITGKTAVIWNSQTSTIIDGDLKKIPVLKEMGLASIIRCSISLPAASRTSTRLTPGPRTAIALPVRCRS